MAPFCANVSQGSVEAARALGWEASYLDGKGSVREFVQAFETAINQKRGAARSVEGVEGKPRLEHRKRPVDESWQPAASA